MDGLPGRAPSNFAGNVADGLPTMLDALRGIPFFGPGEPVHAPMPVPAPGALSAVLDALRPTFSNIEASGLLGDPWSAAALKHDEVRCASVLRWFLDPRGGHGCGDGVLRDLLARVGQRLPGFPATPSPHCFVSVEECPDGDRASRVDIQIDDQNFFLVVEVKIGAPEQPHQIRRYCEIAAARAAQARPWAVVFLTPEGRPSTTAGKKHAAKVIPVSWSHIAGALRRTARAGQPIPRFLAMSFAAHIMDF